jgi:hypothetical protein
MKTLNSLVLAFLFIFLFSCNHDQNNEEIEINSSLITKGAWRLEQVTFNNINGTEINDWISSSTTLTIDDNNSFYRNYISGEWTINDDVLKLSSTQQGLQINNWNYQILELTEKTLKLKIELTEGEYCCDFEQFEEHEILTIVETYNKSE